MTAALVICAQGIPGVASPASSSQLAPPWLTASSSTICRGSVVGNCETWVDADASLGAVALRAGLYKAPLDVVTTGYAQQGVSFVFEDVLDSESGTREYELELAVDSAIASRGPLVPGNGARIEAWFAAWHTECPVDRCENTDTATEIVFSEASFQGEYRAPSEVHGVKFPLSSIVRPTVGSTIPAGKVRIVLTLTAIAKTGNYVPTPSPFEVSAIMSARAESLTVRSLATD